MSITCVSDDQACHQRCAGLIDSAIKPVSIQQQVSLVAEQQLDKQLDVGLVAASGHHRAAENRWSLASSPPHRLLLDIIATFAPADKWEKPLREPFQSLPVSWHVVSEESSCLDVLVAYIFSFFSNVPQKNLFNLQRFTRQDITSLFVSLGKTGTAGQ